uniref:Uncharacterized protein n=1 Tax=Setaria viridis TaxID=4556 RepID=A0A4U6UJN6_SETVI|nr:hypothetical protein SEVIR_6G189450v2 [Setaria viridis]
MLTASSTPANGCPPSTAALIPPFLIQSLSSPPPSSTARRTSCPARPARLPRHLASAAGPTIATTGPATALRPPPLSSADTGAP